MTARTLPTPPPHTIGLLINERNSAALDAARRLVSHFWGRDDVRILARSSVADQVGLVQNGGWKGCFPAEEEQIATASDFAVVFGGDGTLLAAARLMGPKETPILGIHLGHFGFVTEAPPEKLVESVEEVLAGRHRVDSRMMLKGVIRRSNPEVPEEPLLAMNDIVAASSAIRMVHIRTEIGGQTLATYAADGVIVSSPTGSTGYSLSAGGPLVHPDAPVLTVTPIAAHTLSARSLVIPDHEHVRLVVEGPARDGVAVSVDGQIDVPLEAGDSVTITRAPYDVRIISVGGPNFYDKIRSRWHFGERERS